LPQKIDDADIVHGCDSEKSSNEEIDVMIFFLAVSIAIGKKNGKRACYKKELNTYGSIDNNILDKSWIFIQSDLAAMNNQHSKNCKSA
jgi:hypothetical protein